MFVKKNPEPHAREFGANTLNTPWVIDTQGMLRQERKEWLDLP